MKVISISDIPKLSGKSNVLSLASPTALQYNKNKNSLI
jgi:hypothetical protein